MRKAIVFLLLAACAPEGFPDDPVFSDPATLENPGIAPLDPILARANEENATENTEEELQAYFAEHKARYQAPARYTFTQVFLDPDKRGDATLSDAERIKAALIAQGEPKQSAGALGDSLMLQDYYPEKDQAEIQKQFGSGFAESLVALTPGQWHGPVLSGYGVHLVYVSAVAQPPAPDFATVRERVTQDWTTARSEALNEQFYANLREQYTVVIEAPANGKKVSVLAEERR